MGDHCFRKQRKTTEKKTKRRATIWVFFFLFLRTNKRRGDSRQCLNSTTSVQVNGSGQVSHWHSLDRTLEAPGSWQRQPLCLFLLPLGAEQQQRLGEKGVEDDTEHMQQQGWGWGPLLHWPPTCGCVCVNMCGCSFMCVSYMNKNNRDTRRVNYFD